jgi:hypothetical protein
MAHRWAIRASAAALALGAALAGMGFVAGNAAWAAPAPSAVAVSPLHVVVLSGIAVQGPMAASTVIAYAVDPTTAANLSVLGRATTDMSGNFTVKVPQHQRPVRLVATGGSFVSEADGSTVRSSGRLAVLLPSAITDTSGISINPLTTFINALTWTKVRAGQTTFSAALSSATANIELYYGLSTDPRTLTPDYTAVGVGTDAGKLGLILGALINEDQHLCPGKPGGLVTALAADISDGVFNGRNAGLAVPYCGKYLPAIAGTMDFEDALSGVAQLQNVSAGFAFGGNGNVLTVNGLANAALDGSEIYPLAPLAAITTAISKAAPPLKSPSPDMQEPRSDAAATLLNSGKVLIVGGSQDQMSTDIYDPARGTMRAGPAMTPRGLATSVLLRNGKILIIGGDNGTNGLLASTEIYDPASNSIVFGPSMNVQRAKPTATRLRNGTVLVAGGLTWNATDDVLRSTEIYNPATNTFVQGPPMNARHSDAVLLPDGKVLFATTDYSTDIYDPETNRFTVGPNMIVARRMGSPFTSSARGAVSLLSDGRVLFAGGYDTQTGATLSSSEIYDPGANAFVAGPSLNVARTDATATLLPSGKVLVAGGVDSRGIVLSSKEVYDPTTNSFSLSPWPLLVPRISATFTLLPNGGVLIAGGRDAYSIWSKTEIYVP